MNDSPANTLCKACGLCCSGHLFSWVRLNVPELDNVENLGVQVIRNDPRQRGFTQPCPLWRGTCTVYTSPAYPASCRKYKCTVLRRLQDEDITLPEALSVIQETLDLIREIETVMPKAARISFREQLIAHREDLESKADEHNEIDREFVRNAETLLLRYETLFGVDDFIDYDK